MFAETCHCIGNPLRVEPDHCFTCGRDLTHRLSVAERRQDARPGYMALLEAVGRKRREIDSRLRSPAPRHNHRRVVISQQRKNRPRLERPAGVRDLEFLTRAF